MLNEGIIVNDTKTLMKSEMVKQLQRLKRTTPDEWERSVFETLTGSTREDVDWDFEDNQAGYYTWMRSFDGLIEELIDDGYVLEKKVDKDSRVLEATDTDSSLDYSFLTYGHKGNT